MAAGGTEPSSGILVTAPNEVAVVAVEAPHEMPRLEQTRPWTVADLEHLPEGPRYEIVDGALLVMPGPDIWHEGGSATLRQALRDVCPADHRVIGPMGVGLGASYRIPDLVVVHRRAFQERTKELDPADVLLVVEVMSPGSVLNDRVAKPAQYAEHGLRHCWRLETGDEPDGSDAVLVALALPAGASTYVEVGRWRGDEVAELREPLEVRLVPSSLR